MKLEYITILIILVTMVILVVGSQTKKYKFTTKRYLLTEAELNFYDQITQHLTPRQALLCKVRLADLVISSDIGTRKLFGFNKIKSKHIDFVIMDSTTSQILFAIELNDHSHFLTHRIKRDNFVRELFESSSIQFVEVANKANYDEIDFEFLRK